MRHVGFAHLRNPQPIAAEVLQRVLSWIDAVDWASQRDDPRPPFLAEDGGPIFPVEGDENELWCADGRLCSCAFGISVRVSLSPHLENPIGAFC